MDDCRGPVTLDDGYEYCPRTMTLTDDERCEECEADWEWDNDGHHDGGEE